MLAAFIHMYIDIYLYVRSYRQIIILHANISCILLCGKTKSQSMAMVIEPEPKHHLK